MFGHPRHESYRYTDSRGDTIIFKFEPRLIHDSTESPVSVFHEWVQNCIDKILLTSTLLKREDIIDRYKKDKKPVVGTLLWEGKDGSGVWVKCRFVPFEQNARGFALE